MKYALDKKPIRLDNLENWKAETSLSLNYISIQRHGTILVPVRWYQFLLLAESRELNRGWEDNLSHSSYSTKYEKMCRQRKLVSALTTHCKVNSEFSLFASMLGCFTCKKLTCRMSVWKANSYK